MRPLLCLSLVVSITYAVAAQRYDLVEPSGLVSGTAEVGRGRLLVYERTGEKIYFSREGRYDSADGRFVGYFNFELNRVLRFPRAGSGLMQSADLDDAAPRFRNTVRVVRPAGTGVGTSRTGSPSFAAPYPGGVPVIPSFSVPYSDPYRSGYRGAPPLAQSVLIESETIPNPLLPPARVVFLNDGPREVQVGVVDLKDRSGTRSIRIQPGHAVELELLRDSGVKRVAHYRVIDPYGESITKEIVTEIPPTIRFEVVVHEWAMQSIAIDRTGKSPNPIEDINFQGRGIGRFPLPPGPELRSGTIDVYRAARGRGNEGTIAPIFPRERLPADTASPLERTILDAQREAQRSRN